MSCAMKKTPKTELTHQPSLSQCIWDYINRNDHMHLPHNEFTVGHAGRAAGHRTGHFGKVGV